MANSRDFVGSASLGATSGMATTLSDESSGTSRDWKGIGIRAGVGVAVPLLALIAIGVFLWRRHRRRREMYEMPLARSRPYESTSTAVTEEASIRLSKPAYLKAYEVDAAQTYEFNSVAGRVELPLKSPRELPGSEGERQRYQVYRSTVSYDDPYQPG